MKNVTSKTIVMSLATAMLLGMSGCGGGGGSSTPATENPGGNTENPGGTTENPTTSGIKKVDTISGKAVDGYLQYSTVCLDLSGDKFCQSSEPIGQTGEDGSFKLTISKAQQEHEGYKTAQLVIYGGQDSDRPGEDFIGKLQAPNDGSGIVNVTPITSLVSAYLEKNGNEEITQEDIDKAKAKVATQLNINIDKIGDDPRESNDAELINATLQLQYAINAMLEASGETDETKKQEKAENIFTAFAAGLDDAESSKGVPDIIDNMRDGDLDKELIHAKEVAKTAADNIDEILKGQSGELDKEALKTFLTKIVVTQNILIEKVGEQDFSNESVTLEGIAFADLTKDIKDFDTEATKIVLEDLGVEKDKITTKMLEAYKDIGFDDNFEEIEKVEYAEYDISKYINKEKQDQNDEIAKAKAEVSLSDIKEKVDSLLAVDENLVADVDDAKNLVTQVREASTTFIDLDEHVKEQTDTIIGKESKVIEENIKPAVDKISTDFKETSVAMEDSIDAFNKSLDEDFVSVLGNSTIDGNIAKRFNALLREENEDKDEWTTKANGDTLSYTKTTKDGITTSVVTFNDDTITVVTKGNDNNDDEELQSVDGQINLSGENYDLKVTELTFKDGKASLVASGEIKGNNDSVMTLKTLELSLNVNQDENKLSNTTAKFDGKIVAGGRTLTGKLDITKNKLVLDGTYTGLASEPAFVGKVVANLDVDKLVNNELRDTSDWVNPNIAAMVEFEDGTKSFKIGIETVSEYDYSTRTNTHKYTISTQNGKVAHCTAEDINTDNGYKHNFKCENNVKINTYGSNGNSAIILDTNIGDLLIESTSYTRYDMDNGLIGTPILYLDNYDGEVNVQDGKLMLDGEELTIKGIKKVQTHDPIKTDFDIEFIGTITDGDKVVKLTAGIVNKKGKDTKVYAKDVEIKDGKSVATADELYVTIPKSELLDDVEKQKHSEFESYSYNWNDDYGYDEDIEPSSLAINNLSVSIVDKNGDALTFDADISASEKGDNTKISFNGTYEYKDTKFVGIVELDGTEGEEGIDSSVGTFHISGDVKAKGFEPFTITTEGVETSKGIEAYALFTRGENYKLGLHVDTSDNGVKVDLADNNGVIGEYSDIVSAVNDATAEVTTGKGLIDATKEVVENAKPALILKNVKNDTLATFGKDLNGNEWEVKYSDNTTETLF